MKKIIAPVLSLFTLMFPPSAIAQAPVNSQLQTPQTQAIREDLIVVAARALEDRKFLLALRVANNVTDLFPGYATGYLYRAMAAPAVPGIALFRLGEVQAAKLDFDKAKRLGRVCELSYFKKRVRSS